MTGRSIFRSVAVVTTALASLALTAQTALAGTVTIEIAGPGATGTIDGAPFSSATWRMAVDVDDTVADSNPDAGFGVFPASITGARIEIEGTVYELAGDSALGEVALEDISKYLPTAGGDRIFFRLGSGGSLGMITGDDGLFGVLFTDNNDLQTVNPGASATNATADPYNNSSSISYTIFDCEEELGVPQDDEECLEFLETEHNPLIGSGGEVIEIRAGNGPGAGDWTATVSQTSGPPPPPPPVVHVRFQGSAANGNVDGLAFFNRPWVLEVAVATDSADSNADPAFGAFRSSSVSSARLRIEPFIYELAGDSAIGQLSLEDISKLGSNGDRIWFHPDSGGYTQFAVGDDTFFPALFTDNNDLQSAIVGSTATNNTTDSFNNSSALSFQALNCPDFGFPPNDPTCLQIFGSLDNGLTGVGGESISITAADGPAGGDWRVRIGDYSTLECEVCLEIQCIAPCLAIAQADFDQCAEDLADEEPELIEDECGPTRDAIISRCNNHLGPNYYNCLDTTAATLGELTVEESQAPACTAECGGTVLPPGCFTAGSLLGTPGVTFPTRPAVPVGDSLQFASGASNSTLISIPLFAAGELAVDSFVTVNATINRTRVTEDDDLNVVVSDGARGIGIAAQDNGDGLIIAYHVGFTGETYGIIDETILTSGGAPLPPIGGITEYGMTTEHSCALTTLDVGTWGPQSGQHTFNSALDRSQAISLSVLAEGGTEEYRINTICITTEVTSDTTPPTLSLSGGNPQELECASSYAELGATASAACVGDITGAIAIDTSAVNMDAVGSYAVDYAVSDPFSNASSTSRTVSIVDTTAPAITLAGANPQPVECATSYGELGASASDTCAGDLSGAITIDATGVDISAVGSYDVAYAVSDGFNSSTAHRTVGVSDTTAPSITCPGPSSAECTDGAALVNPGVATASDSCSSVMVTAPGEGSYPLGETEVEYIATDAQGNEANCATQVAVVDLIAPELTLSGANPQGIECADAYVELGATASDVCAGDLTASITIDASAVATSSVDSYAVAYAVTDGPNGASANRTVNVTDSTPPGITLLGANPQRVECAGSYAELGATASDACAGDLTASITIDASAVDASAVDSYAVAYDVSDGFNAASASRAVNVTDSTRPGLTLLGANPQIVECGVAYPELGATSNDACAGDLTGAITIDTAEVDTAYPGSFVVGYDVTDGFNAASDTRDVEVEDTLAPVVTLNGDATMTIECALETFSDAGASASDLCDTNVPVSVTGAVVATAVGSYPLTYTGRDDSGHSASAQRLVNVADSTAPIMALNGDSPATLECDRATSYVDPGATAVDACSGDLTGAISASNDVDAGAVGSYTASYSVNDAQGNASSLSRAVGVVDTTSPILTTPNAISVVATGPDGASATHPEIAAFLASATVSDVCDGDVSVSVDAPAVFGLGATAVTFSAEDAEGNAISVDVSVTVTDGTPPLTEIALLDPDDDGLPSAFTLSATDNATGVATTEYALDGGAFVPYIGETAIPNGTTSISFRSTDFAGNVEDSQSVSVSADMCADTAGFSVPEEYVLEILDFETTAPNSEATARVFVGDQEIHPDADGKYRVAITDADGEPIVDDTDYNALPKGVWVIDRRGHRRARHHQQRQLVVRSGVWGKFSGGGYTWFSARVSFAGAGYVTNYRKHRFERYMDGIATEGQLGQDELTISTNANGDTEILAQATVRPGSDLFEVEYADLQGCPFANRTTAQLRIVDQAGTGVCGTRSNGHPRRSCNLPIDDMPVKVFDRQDADFEAMFGRRPNRHLYDDIFEADIGKVGECTTDEDGECLAPEDHPGKFLVIAKLVDTDADITVYQGRNTNFRGRVIRAFHEAEDDDEDLTQEISIKNRVKHKHLRFIKRIKRNGAVKYSSSGRNIVIGSQIDIDSVDYMVWDGTEELYPFVFSSEQDWTVDVCMSVPQGYEVAGILDLDGEVVDATECLHTMVADEEKTFLFRVVDLESPEPNLTIAMNVERHGGELTKITKRVEGMRAWTEDEVEREIDAKVSAFVAKRDHAPSSPVKVAPVKSAPIATQVANRSVGDEAPGTIGDDSTRGVAKAPGRASVDDGSAKARVVAPPERRWSLALVAVGLLGFVLGSRRRRRR